MAGFRKMQARVQRTRASRIQVSIADYVPAGSTNMGGNIPFVIGVIADMSINPDPSRAPLWDPNRDFVHVHKGNFDKILERFKARLRFQVPDVINGGNKSLNVDIQPKKMDDLHPDQVIAQVGLLKEAKALMERLSSLSGILDNHPLIDEQLSSLINDPEGRARLIAAIEPPAPGSGSAPEGIEK